LLSRTTASNLLDYGKYIVLTHDQMFFAIDLDFLTRVFAEKDPIAFLNS
jgi:hypothetical protein